MKDKKVIVIILLIIIVSLGDYVLYKEVNNKKQIDNNSTTENNQIESDIQLKIKKKT